jgi:hypothetical protein
VRRLRMLKWSGGARWSVELDVGRSTLAGTGSGVELGELAQGGQKQRRVRDGLWQCRQRSWCAASAAAYELVREPRCPRATRKMESRRRNQCDENLRASDSGSATDNRFPASSLASATMRLRKQRFPLAQTLIQGLSLTAIQLSIPKTLRDGSLG